MLLSIYFSGTLGCTSPGHWVWEPGSELVPTSSKQEAIRFCEEDTAENDRDMQTGMLVNARPYGGWGNFYFEHCMAQHGWHLTLVTSEPSFRAE